MTTEQRNVRKKTAKDSQFLYQMRIKERRKEAEEKNDSIHRRKQYKRGNFWQKSE